MTLGVLSTRARAQPVHGLGAWTSTIPAECWDQSGFKECDAEQYAAAKVACQAKGQDNDACIGPLADQKAMANCPCKRTTKTTAAPKKVVTSSTTPSLEPLEPEPTLLGLPMKTVAMIGALGVGLYLFTQQKGK